MSQKITLYLSNTLRKNGDFIQVQKLTLEKTDLCDCLNNKSKSNSFIGFGIRFIQIIIIFIFNEINQLFIYL